VGAIIQYLFIGANNPAMGAPPYLGIIVICKPVIGCIVQNSVLAFFPYMLRNVQFFDGSAFLLFGIKPCIVQLDEDPLCPSKITRIGGIDLTVPVVSQSQGFNLSAEVFTIFLCGGSWMGPCLNGILFGRQSIGIPSHGMKNIKTLHPFIPGHNISCGVSFRMSHMQT